MGNAGGRPRRGWRTRIIPQAADPGGVKDSDIPTQFSDWTRGGVNEDALCGFKGKRERAPVKEVKVSDDPSAFLGEDAMGTLETLAGKR